MPRIVSAPRISRTSTSVHPTHLAPFALCQAFPDSDYYGASVAVGVSPVRRSRVPAIVDVQVAVGALFVSLRSLQTIPLPQACRRRRSFTSGGAITAVSRCSRAESFTGWTLGFKQFSLHHGNRASTGVELNGFVPPCLPSHAAFPHRFRMEVVTPPRLDWWPRSLTLTSSRVARGSNDAVTRRTDPAPLPDPLRERHVLESLLAGRVRWSRGFGLGLLRYQRPNQVVDLSSVRDVAERNTAYRPGGGLLLVCCAAVRLPNNESYRPRTLSGMGFLRGSIES
jgi:hypothetical protein